MTGPRDDARDPEDDEKLLDDLDPDETDAAGVDGGYQMQDSAWSLQRV